jgi:glycosyltransferase involved in cell wall biosynthesis
MMKISVVIPTRNNSHRFATPLKTLLQQTLAPTDYEVIVVDNGSTDETPQILARLSEQAPQLRWVTEPIPGKSSARNRGIREAQGELIIFIDDDILVEGDHLEKHQRYHLEASQAVAVLGAVIDISPMEPGWLQDYFQARQWLSSPQTRVKPGWAYVATDTLSVKRETLEQVKMRSGSMPTYFDLDFKMRQDGELGFRLHQIGVKFIFANDIICRHNHPRNLQAMVNRSYGIGYATAQFIKKHPETKPILEEPHLPTAPLAKLALAILLLLLVIPTFLLRPLWIEPSRKVIGLFLQYHRIRGYQAGLRQLR